MKLRLVRLSDAAWETLQKDETNNLTRAPGVEILDEDKVDARHTGPRSGYGKALAALRSNKEFPRAQFNAEVKAMVPATEGREESRSPSIDR